jgi:hypothetical protein
VFAQASMLSWYAPSPLGLSTGLSINLGY